MQTYYCNFVNKVCTKKKKKEIDDFIGSLSWRFIVLDSGHRSYIEKIDEVAIFDRLKTFFHLFVYIHQRCLKYIQEFTSHLYSKSILLHPIFMN